MSISNKSLIGFLALFYCPILVSSFEECIQASKAVLATQSNHYRQASHNLARVLEKYKALGGDVNKLVFIKILLEKRLSDSADFNFRQARNVCKELSYDDHSLYSLLMIFTFAGYSQEVQSLMAVGADCLHEGPTRLNALDIGIVRLAVSEEQDIKNRLNVLQELLAGLSNQKKIAYCSGSLHKLRSNPELVQIVAKGFDRYQVMACLGTQFERQLLVKIVNY